MTQPDTVPEMIVENLEMTPTEFERSTGWAIKPEGACKGDVCVPLARGGAFDLRDAARRLGMAVVTDEASGSTAIGPETIGERALTTAVAPELVLSGLDGKEFRLSSLRGKKVVVVSWAPY